MESELSPNSVHMAIIEQNSLILNCTLNNLEIELFSAHHGPWISDIHLYSIYYIQGTSSLVGELTIIPDSNISLCNTWYVVVHFHRLL